MKVLLHYEDNENTELHKSLKITLPKSWKTGPCSKLLAQFVESYTLAPLNESEMHLAIRDEQKQMNPLASDATVLDVIADRADVYVMHGPSSTLEELRAAQVEARRQQEEMKQNSVPCTHFGCKNRFPRGGPYPDCVYHKAPPVFHETAKYWSCCPHKKAYDWEDFQSIPGCCTGKCSDVKDGEAKLFLGGTDLREQVGESVKLKTIDDFNKSQAAGGSEAAPVLDRLQGVLQELGMEKELFQQVVEGMKKELAGSSEAETLEAVKEELGKKLKSSFKTIAAEQLRIK